MSTKQTFNQKFWDDKHGNFVVWQKPNIWLATWFVALVVGWFVPYGWPSKSLSWVSLIALIIWALLEAYSGVNYFRRLLGILVLLLMIMSRIVAI